MRYIIDYDALKLKIMESQYQVVQKLIEWKFLFWSDSYYVFIIKRKRKFYDNCWKYYIKDHEEYEEACWEKSPELYKLKTFKTEQDAMNFLNYHILKKTDNMYDEYVCHTVSQ